MELVNNGSLDKHIRALKKTDETLPMQQFLPLILGIAKGMEHLISNGIVHRDLAARNILVTEDLKPKISSYLNGVILAHFLIHLHNR